MRKVLVVAVALLLIFCAMSRVYATTVTVTPTSTSGGSVKLQFCISENARDGWVDGENTVWANALTNANQTNHYAMVAGAENNGYGQYNVYRSFLYFDTSVIPSSATITSATLCLYTRFDNGSDGEKLLYAHNWTGGTPIMNDDFTQYSAGSIGNASNFVDYSWMYMTINVNAVVKGGATTICLRCQQDEDSSAPSNYGYYTIEDFNAGSGHGAFLDVVVDKIEPTKYNNIVSNTDGQYLRGDADSGKFLHYWICLNPDGYNSSKKPRTDLVYGGQQYFNVNASKTWNVTAYFGDYNYTFKNGNEQYTVFMDLTFDGKVNMRDYSNVLNPLMYKDSGDADWESSGAHAVDILTNNDGVINMRDTSLWTTYFGYDLEDLVWD